MEQKWYIGGGCEMHMLLGSVQSSSEASHSPHIGDGYGHSPEADLFSDMEICSPWGGGKALGLNAKRDSW